MSDPNAAAVQKGTLADNSDRIVAFDRPIFISGLGRSGTTLILKLLDSHPQLLVIPVETLFFRKVLFALERDGMKAALAEIRTAMAPAAHLKTRTFSLDEFIDRVAARSPASSGEDLLKAMVVAYGDMTDQTGRIAWVEKTPGNHVYLPRMAAWLPKLKVIHMVRDPRAVFQSETEIKIKHPDREPITAEALAFKWLNGQALWETAPVPAPRRLLLRYESLVADPRAEMTRVANFLEIAWSDTLLQPTTLGEEWLGNAFDKQRNLSGTVREADERWRDLLAFEDIATIEALCGAFMSRAGYDLISGPGVQHQAGYKPAPGLRMALGEYSRSLGRLERVLPVSPEGGIA